MRNKRESEICQVTLPLCWAYFPSSGSVTSVLCYHQLKWSKKKKQYLFPPNLWPFLSWQPWHALVKCLARESRKWAAAKGILPPFWLTTYIVSQLICNGVKHIFKIEEQYWLVWKSFKLVFKISQLYLLSAMWPCKIFEPFLKNIQVFVPQF